MINTKRNNIGTTIITATIIIIILIISSVLFIVNNINNNSEELNKRSSIDCKISLQYTNYLNQSIIEEIALNSIEEKELNEIINNLEFSNSIDGIIKYKYIINYCESKLLVGEDKIISNDNEIVEVTKGYNELSNFLKKQDSKINRVYLYKENLDTGLKNYDISLEDKNKIRKIWNQQEKNIEYIDLAIKEGYTLVIDDEILKISPETPYINYKDGFIRLNQEIIDIINKYTAQTNKLIEYTIDNEMGYYNKQYNERGVTYNTFNTPNAPSIYFIASGEKTTGGYTISIKEVIVDEEGNVVIVIKETKPDLGSITTQAFTYPVCSIKFKYAPQNIVFKTEDGEIFKNLNF